MSRGEQRGRTEWGRSSGSSRSSRSTGSSGSSADDTTTPVGRSDEARFEVETARLDPRPSRTGTALAGLVGLAAVAAQVPAGPAVVVGATGLVALVVGLERGLRRLVSLGVLGLVLGVLAAGAVGLPSELLLVSAAGSAVAWDVADHAVSLGAQVGRDADTARAELVHAAGSALVASVAVAAAYLVFRSVAGGPVLALVLLLVGAVLLASVLRG